MSDYEWLLRVLAAMLAFVIVFALVVSAVDVRRSKRGAR